MRDDSDDTVRLKRPRAALAPSTLAIFAVSVVAAAVIGGFSGWYFSRPATPPQLAQAPVAEPAPVAVPVPVVVPVPAPPAAAPASPAAPASAPAAPVSSAPVSSASAPSVLVPPGSTPSVSAPPIPAPPAPALPTLALPTLAMAPALVAPPPRFVLPSATEAEILADAPNAPKFYRFAPGPTVIVAQYPSLGEQAQALNRIAALIEKAGFPRDRILEMPELERRIRATGASPETFYYGHDYRAADVVRFFALAQSAGVALTPAEAVLRDLTAKLGWGEGTPGALISLTRLDPATGLDPKARATVLRHELSHGEYFTNPTYAAYVQRFWATTLSDAERRAFTNFLGSEGYDTGITDLVINEMQAYLMHTPDSRFFNAVAVGLPERSLDRLRGLFLTGMPAGWLRDCTSVPAAPPLPIQVRAPRCSPPARRKRPRQRRRLAAAAA